jgi:hypothetical protein
MTKATGRPTFANPEKVEAKRRALLDLIADRPGLRMFELALVTTEPASATATRLQRLRDRGEIERTPTHKWFIAGTAPDAAGPDLSLDDERLLSAMRIIPGGSAAEIAALIGVSRSSVSGRWHRHGRCGVLEKDSRGHWRLAERERQSDDEDVSEFEKSAQRRGSCSIERSGYGRSIFT